MTYTETNGEVVFHRLARNYSLENHFISALLKLGLTNRQDSLFLPLELQHKDDHYLFYELVNWLNFNSEELQQQGFEIRQEASPSKYYLTVHTDQNRCQSSAG